MIEKKLKSAVPLYIVAALWIVCSFFVPLYKLSAIIIMLIVSAAVYFLAAKLFPGETVMEEVPVDTGDTELDEMIKSGREAMAELDRLEKKFGGDMAPKLSTLRETLGKILEEAERDENDRRSVKRFTDYYVPVTLKILHSYEMLSSQGGAGENVSEAMGKVENILDLLCTAYEKQLDSMFENESMDVSADVDVLESMIQGSGLAGGGDFDEFLKH